MHPPQHTHDDPDAERDAQVRPANWANPAPTGRYNLVVLGGGTAGLVAAAGAAGLGARVALVERGRLGGDCLNVGCVPSKALVRSARALADVRGSGEFGVRVGREVTVDFPAVMARMRRLRAGISPHDSAARFRGLGVDVCFGDGTFTGPDTLEVAGQTYRFKRALIATGSRPAVPPVPGLAEAGYLTNENVFELTELPGRLVVLGAGPIGCELAQAFARFGSRVTLVDRGTQLLGREDPQAAWAVEAALRRDGVTLRQGASVARVRVEGGEKVVTIEAGGESSEVRADAILVGVGRAPNVEGLGLDAAGVAAGKPGVTVDDRLRTTNPRVFAAGDVASAFKFTHAADALARVALRNALFHGRARASALTIPWCTYTDPEVARVGLNEAEARARGVQVRAFAQPFSEVDRAVLDGETAGFVKVLVRDGTDTIVGATVVARHAGDLIAEVTLAMTAGLGLRALGRAVHPYPTQAEAFKKAGDACERTRLTPTVKGLFDRWLRWTR